ncbi:MAG TPA: glycosyltransferase family 9 protein [Pseudolabrys sp.]|uniref:glycosyltransferase family 9 protein n=1 Tax=Pseudolabrys sp. TaxID=1960880 RepID=UPI002DDDAEA2|nr:glycosyltransferase family 9 protein [Pseudolabrys sp.]HEV2627369.1 glycosyltransferase family 9 protein [Pseudolabrys sp.]
MTAFAVIQLKPGIGDTLWHLPFVRAIASAAPGGQVTFLSPPSSLARELLVAEPKITEVLYFAHGGNEITRGLNVLRLARLMRSRNFQRIYILDRTTRPAVAAWLAGIPERIGIGLGAQRGWITNPGIDRAHFHAHPIGWLKQLILSEGLNLPSTEPDLPVPANALVDIDTRFGHLPRPWLVLGLGASHPEKDWPDEHWCALLQGLAHACRATVFMIGGPTWRARAKRIIDDSAVDAVNACDLPILQSAALCQRADLFVGADSGALNLAAAVGTKAYGLFGLTPALDYSRYIHVIRAGDDPVAQTSMREIAPRRVISLIAVELESIHPRQPAPH